MKIGQALASIQGTALFLVVFGSAVTFVGCKWNWAELKTLGAGISGAGLQAITSQIRSYLKNEDGGTVNVNPPAQAA
jgi:hypothetical protein